jgi:ribosomal protein uS7
MEEIKLFGKWSFDGIQVEDPGLKQYISVKSVYVPHSMGRHEHGKFHKAKVSIVERLINNLMRPGSCAGKKTRAITLVRNAFEIVNVQTGQNPIQVLVTAVENTSPGEDTLASVTVVSLIIWLWTFLRRGGLILLYVFFPRAQESSLSVTPKLWMSILPKSCC